MKYSILVIMIVLSVVSAAAAISTYEFALLGVMLAIVGALLIITYVSEIRKSFY